MVDIQTVSVAIASAGVLVGVVYYVLDMRHQNKIRRTDLDLRLFSIATSNEFLDAMSKIASMHVKDYEDYLKQCEPPSGSSMRRAVIIVGGFYGELGGLLKRKLIDIDLVYDIIGSRYPPVLYEKLKPVIFGMRESEPTALVEFEYLVDELKRKEPQLKKTWSKYLSQTSSS